MGFGEDFLNTVNNSI